jgi:putative transposase
MFVSVAGPNKAHWDALLETLAELGLTDDRQRIVTDKLRSYGTARRDAMLAVEHPSHKGINNRAENSHVPLRKLERMMQGFRTVGA